MTRVFYDGNGNSGGSVPTDSTVYNPGDTVTIQDNTGHLTKGADTFAYWNQASHGTGNVEFPTGTFVIGASDVTLFAQWFTTSGLPTGGTTTHYKFVYDSSLATAGLEPARTTTLMSKCEADFAEMKTWFGGIELSFAYPVDVHVANLGGGASWGSQGITLKGGNGDADFLRDLLVAEVTEMFMLAQGKGWFAPDGSNEQSSGEGLSHFLNEQFEINDGRPPGLAFNAFRWLNSGLPTSNPSSTRIGPPPANFDYGARGDWVNHVLEYDHTNSAASGCSVLFLWYLFTQLGFSVADICQKAASTPGGVYRNLTGDNADPFPFFKALLDNAYPATSPQSPPGPNPDNPFPLALVSFWVDKSTFGHDEVQDVLATHAGRFTDAFWLVIEGFSINRFTALGVDVGAFTGAFTTLPGVHVARSATPIDFEDPTHPDRLQRIRVAFDVTFSQSSLGSFPHSGQPARTYELDGKVTISGATPRGGTAGTLFELTAGADPYFTNIDPNQGNVFYLSQDLRVFTATPGRNGTPVAGGPGFGADSVTGAYAYLQGLLTHLNATYADPSGTDPFATVLPGQGGALTGDSSVNPVTVDIEFPPGSFIPTINIFNNYNFAIARVRMRGLSGDITPAVRVFFRLWSTQTADTDFQPATTYLSTQTGGHPSAPLVGIGDRTLPFFATGNGGATDYTPHGANIHDITLDIGDTKWVYYGCFLNLYDPGNIVDGHPVQALLNGTHHCLVAEIACDTTPILTSGSVPVGPENSDKLAQRNLQVTTSDNPGGAASHRIPQTFDVRPSLPLIDLPGSLLNYPDELMIDWGNTPIGATAHIFWPQVDEADVLDLAASLYSNQSLSSGAAHTIDCRVTGGVTYVPIPPGTADGFAGLLTVDLPTTVVAGQQLDLVVRRISTRRPNTYSTTRPPGIRAGSSTDLAEPSDAGPATLATDPETRTDLPGPNDPQPGEPGGRFSRVSNWRYVTGTFQVRIPVGTPETLLAPEMNTLAIMKWRLQQMSPANRWYPVLDRYVLYLGGRVRELGGDPDMVPPSPQGYWQTPDGGTVGKGGSITGKVAEVVYDCRGRMEGFVVRECCDLVHRFTACDRDLEDLVLRACTQRFEVTVVTEAAHPDRVVRFIVNG